MNSTKLPASRGEILFIVGVLLVGALLGAIATSKMPAKQPAGLPTPFDADSEKITFKDEVIATGLEIPWDLAEEPDGRILITERTGKLKAMSLDKSIKTLAEIPVATVSESGLTGIALHPDYQNNRQLYLYYTFRQGGELLNKVVRYTLSNDQLKEDKVIIERLPGGQIHNGGRLRFGPDGQLYIETGDAAKPSLAQDPNSLAGKILRYNADGTIPADNPDPNSPIYTSGHRNPQGLAWHPLTEELYATEHGETAKDELNRLVPGGDYGWKAENQNSVKPILSSGNDTWAPSGLAFYGTSIWGLRNSAFMAKLRGKRLTRLEIVDGQVKSQEDLLVNRYGRLRAVIVTKDGNLLITTSNRDGRATPATDDDRIIKLTPIRANQP